MSEFDYATLLKRAKAKLPDHASSHERFQIPEADLMLEGKNTVFRNFGDVADTIRRDPAAIMAFLLRELGTAGNIDGRRAIFKTKLGTEQVMTRLKAYVSTFVLCSECQRPDTKLVKEGRTLILECEACGAHRPVNVPKSGGTPDGPALEVGKVYEVQIQDLGKKGDGIARLDKYIIFIPGTSKGTTVKVKIENISGTNAFGHVAVE